MRRRVQGTGGGSRGEKEKEGKRRVGRKGWDGEKSNGRDSREVDGCEAMKDN